MLREPLSESGTKGFRENNRTTITGQWENRLGINKEQWGDSNGDAKCVRGPMGEFTRMVRYRKGTEIVGTIDKGLGPRVQKHGLECRHVMSDVELGLNTTRGDGLNNLEGVGVGGGEHTNKS